MTRKKEKDFDKRLKDTEGRQPRRRKTDNKKVEGAQKKPKRVKVSVSTDGLAFQELGKGLFSMDHVFNDIRESILNTCMQEAFSMHPLGRLMAEQAKMRNGKTPDANPLSEDDCVRVYGQAIAELEPYRALSLPPEERAAFVNDLLARAGLPGEFVGGVHDSMSIYVTNEQMREYAEAQQKEEPAK